jgi:ADP-heptose:LPS heptosyltransferase
MGIPTMRAFRRRYPEARMVALVMPHNQALLEPLELFDDFIVCSILPFTIWPWRSPKLWAVKRQICKERFDLTLTLLGGDWAPFLYRIGAPVRIDVQNSFFAPLATHLYEVPVRLLHPDTLLNAVRALGWEVEPELPRLRSSAKAQTDLEARLLAKGYDPNRKLLVFHPFARTANRALSSEKTLNLIDAFLSQGWQVALIGGSPFICEKQAKRAGFLDFTGASSLSESMALIENRMAS